MFRYLLIIFMQFVTTATAFPQTSEKLCLEIDTINLNQIDLSKDFELKGIIRTVTKQQKRDKSEEEGYYSVYIANCKHGYVVSVTYHSMSTLFYSENEYTGFAKTDEGIPIIFYVRGSYKLKYLKPEIIQKFEMKGKNYPIFVYDPKNWWFFLSKSHYKEIDEWTAIEMLTDEYGTGR